MGLIARAIEARGIATVTLGKIRELLEQVKPPRGVVVKAKFGAPLGAPLNRGLHEKVVMDSLNLLVNATEPGTIIELPYGWDEAE